MLQDVDRLQQMITRGGEVYADYYSFDGCYNKIVAREIA